MLHCCNCNTAAKQERKKAEAAALEAGDTPTDETVSTVTAAAKQEDVVNDGQPIQHANLNRARQGGKRPPTRSLKAFPTVTAATVTDAGVSSPAAVTAASSEAAADSEEQPDVSKLAIDDSAEQ